ncbi:hypothetical protein BV20DRAFT_853342 [Pilatotrama ljubarskyi]|nr:hypothetical protein BV20DRAFT_853342 [Pilatotrama ljubarskyi]
MIHSLPCYLLAICAAFLSANARVLRARAEEEDSGTEDTGPDGHLTEPWVAAVAATLAVLISTVAAVILIIKWRQARRRRREENYSRTPDEQTVEGRRSPQRPFHGPYGISPSSRTPTPPSPAHLSEKVHWAPLPPQR